MASNSTLRGGLGKRDETITVTVTGDTSRSRKPAVVGEFNPRDVNTLTADEEYDGTESDKPQPRRNRVRATVADLLSAYADYAEDCRGHGQETRSPAEWAAAFAPYADQDVVTEFVAKVEQELASVVVPAPPPGTVLPATTGDPVTDAAVDTLKGRAWAMSRYALIGVLVVAAASTLVLGMIGVYLTCGAFFALAFFGYPLQQVLAKGMYAVVTLRTWVKAVFWLANIGMLCGGVAAAVAGIYPTESAAVAIVAGILMVLASAVQHMVDDFAADIRAAKDQTMVMHMIETRTVSG